MMSAELPERWHSIYLERQQAIRTRLQEFADVPPDRYFYEIAYCILTPQSSARNAGAAVADLERDRFLELGFDPTEYLRNPAHYVRFHNKKSAFLLRIREDFPKLLEIVRSERSPQDKREAVLANFKGLGMKEASHFLRNVGVRSLAILDRHIFKHLQQLGVIAEVPQNAPSKKEYLDIERAWHIYAEEVGISLDELDLLFWSMETGEILK